MIVRQKKVSTWKGIKIFIQKHEWLIMALIITIFICVVAHGIANIPEGR